MRDVTDSILSADDRDVLLRLARGVLEAWLRDRRAVTAVDLGLRVSPALQAPGAAFVTLTRADGSLRGCIGEIAAVRPLHESVMTHAVLAATDDPRFEAVTAAELPELRIEISVLTPPRPVDGPGAIVLGRHGIILTALRRRALFLPQVAPEQGWDLETTLNHLSLKAGLPAGAWRSGATFEVFEAIVFGEER